MKKKLMLLLAGVMLMTTLAGCFNPMTPIGVLFGLGEIMGEVCDYTPWKKTVLLNERQKQLLREVGLSDDYDELSLVQKDAIVKIENCTRYMEEKYPEDCGKFSYSGFFGDQVTLKVQDSMPEFHVIVDIYSENGKTVYKDNYENYLIRDAYKAELRGFFSEYLDPADFLIIPSIQKVKDAGDTAAARVIGVPTIVLKHVERRKIIEIALAYADWMQDEIHKYEGTVYLESYSEEYYRQITEDNYNNTIGNWPEKAEARLKASFEKDKHHYIKFWK